MPISDLYIYLKVFRSIELELFRGGSTGYRAYLMIRSDFSDILFVYNVGHLCYVDSDIRNLNQYDIKLSLSLAIVNEISLQTIICRKSFDNSRLYAWKNPRKTPL